MPTLKPLLLLFLLSPTPTLTHSPTTTLHPYPSLHSSLLSLSNSVHTLSSALAAYTGGSISNAIPISENNTAIDVKINSTVSDLSDVYPKPLGMTSKQCRKLAEFFDKRLVGAISKTLEALVAKKSEFEAAGLKDVVRGEMKSHSQGWLAIATGLGEGCPGRKQGGRKIIKAEKKVEEIYSRASVAYS